MYHLVHQDRSNSSNYKNQYTLENDLEYNNNHQSSHIYGEMNDKNYEIQNVKSTRVGFFNKNKTRSRGYKGLTGNSSENEYFQIKAFDNTYLPGLSNLKKAIGIKKYTGMTTENIEEPNNDNIQENSHNDINYDYDWSELKDYPVLFVETHQNLARPLRFVHTLLLAHRVA